MSGYGFEKDVDYTLYLKVHPQNLQLLEDHGITVDMAKQICMIQRSEKGKQYRQYFIGLEKAWNTPEQIMARALKMAQQSIDGLKHQCDFLGKQVTEQQKVIERMEPKVTYYDLILQCPVLINTTVIAKDYGMSAQKFNLMLNGMGIQFKQREAWVLYAKYQGHGYLKTMTNHYFDYSGKSHARIQSYWTQTGRLFLYDFLKQRNVLPLFDKKTA